MKRIGLVLLVAAALAIPAANANAASAPTAAQVNALSKSVKALQKQVKTLQTQVKKLQSDQNLIFNATTAVLVCQTALIADEFQATWNVIDQISAATQSGKTYFGAQTPVSDANLCAAFKLTRPSIVPPNTAVFSSLITLLTT
jgi:hypothetical protein